MTPAQLCDTIANDLEEALTPKHVGFVLIIVETDGESKDGENFVTKGCTLRTNMGQTSALRVMKTAIEHAPQ